MRYHQIKLRAVFYWNTFKDISTSNIQKGRASNKHSCSTMMINNVC